MFCTTCGKRIADDANFCVACGSAVKHPDAPVAAPPPPASAPPPVAAQQNPPNTCPWCGALADASLSACPRCGAALAMRTQITRSGWVQLPGRKDMAKLQFGNSFCQVEGAYVPVADFNLAPADSVYFAHHVLLWKDPQVNVTTMSLKGAWKRLFAGMPLVMTQA